MTFHNIPPGVYQLVVNRYSGTGPGIDSEVPRVEIYIGSGTDEDAVRFDCRMDMVACRREETELWNVVNVVLKAHGTQRKIPEAFQDQINYVPGGDVVVVETLEVDGYSIQRGIRGTVASVDAGNIMVDFHVPTGIEVDW